jgi:hypothetical protein
MFKVSNSPSALLDRAVSDPNGVLVGIHNTTLDIITQSVLMLLQITLNRPWTSCRCSAATRMTKVSCAVV